TRFSRDWSSDVCSSDLTSQLAPPASFSPASSLITKSSSNVVTSGLSQSPSIYDSATPIVAAEKARVGNFQLRRISSARGPGPLRSEERRGGIGRGRGRV